MPCRTSARTRHRLIVSLLLPLAAWPASQAAMAADACTALTAQDAATLLGVALPGNMKSDSPAMPENGHDHTTVCGWFPAGYDLATADGPPSRGILLTVHEMRTANDAKAFHERMAEMTREMAQSGGAEAAVTEPAGVGTAAVMDVKKLEGAQVATVQFLDGTRAMQIQVWHAQAAPGEIAVAAAKQVAARL
ncbi:MAG: hypothetical protein AB7Q97_22490 [Gammaproteobacteria bacterium]